MQQHHAATLALGGGSDLELGFRCTGTEATLLQCAGITHQESCVQHAGVLCCKLCWEEIYNKISVVSLQVKITQHVLYCHYLETHHVQHVTTHVPDNHHVKTAIAHALYCGTHHLVKTAIAGVVVHQYLVQTAIAHTLQLHNNKPLGPPQPWGQRQKLPMERGMMDTCAALGGGLGGLCGFLVILLVGVVMGWVWTCHSKTRKFELQER